MVVGKIWIEEEKLMEGKAFIGDKARLSQDNHKTITEQSQDITEQGKTRQ